jgi:hypothetical protein
MGVIEQLVEAAEEWDDNLLNLKQNTQQENQEQGFIPYNNRWS